MYVRNTTSHPALPAERRMRGRDRAGLPSRPGAIGEDDAMTTIDPQAARPTPRLRLTRRGRAVLGIAAAVPAIALAVGAATLVGAQSAGASSTASSAAYDYVQVREGGSLWELAAAVSPGDDPREVVSDILRLNGLSSGDVRPGQRLAVPEQYAN